VNAGFASLLFGSTGAALIGVLPFRTPTSADSVVWRSLASISASLFGYLAFRHLGYATWNWPPFSTWSSAPAWIAVCGPALGSFGIARRAGFTGSHFLVFCTLIVTIFVCLFLVGEVVVSCSNGNCF